MFIDIFSGGASSTRLWSASTSNRFYLSAGHFFARILRAEFPSCIALLDSGRYNMSVQGCLDIFQINLRRLLFSESSS